MPTPNFVLHTKSHAEVGDRLKDDEKLSVDMVISTREHDGWKHQVFLEGARKDFYTPKPKPSYPAKRRRSHVSDF
jgi:hypothetical protein